MHLSPATTHAIAACYDAAIDPGLWPSALQRLGESLGAQSCTFGTWDAASDPFRMPRSEGHEEFAELWLSHQPHASDPHIDRGRRLSRSRGGFLLEQDISSDRERQTLPYYGEIADPGDRKWWAAVNFTVGTRHWCLPLYRSARRGAFTSQDASYAAWAAPELSRLVRLAEKLADSNLTVGLNTLEKFSCAAVVIDARGKATRTNKAADLLLSSGLDLHGGRLRIGDARSSVDLRELLGQRGGTTWSSSTPSARILYRNGLPTFLVEVLPVAVFVRDYFAPGVAVVTLSEVAVPHLAKVEALGDAFRLTPAESRLAVEICKGQGIQASSDTLGIGVETARSQLRSIFAKTGTSRQAELVGLLLSFRH